MYKKKSSSRFLFWESYFFKKAILGLKVFQSTQAGTSQTNNLIYSFILESHIGCKDFVCFAVMIYIQAIILQQFQNWWFINKGPINNFIGCTPCNGSPNVQLSGVICVVTNPVAVSGLPNLTVFPILETVTALRSILALPYHVWFLIPPPFLWVPGCIRTSLLTPLTS